MDKKLGKRIFVDTSFWKALVDSTDDFHNQAEDIFVDESLTLLRRRRGLKFCLVLKR